MKGRKQRRTRGRGGKKGGRRTRREWGKQRGEEKELIECQEMSVMRKTKAG